MATRKLAAVLLALGLALSVAACSSGVSKDSGKDTTPPASSGGTSDTTSGSNNTTPEAVPDITQMGPNNLPSGWKIPKRIGHVTNYLVHEWYQNETKGEKLRAEDYGIDFSINDANLDLQKSLGAVDDYVAQKLDALVFTPVDEKASVPAVRKAISAGIPVVTEGSPVDGHTSLVAIDDYQAGVNVGKWAGEYFKKNLPGVTPKVLDVGLPALTTTVARSDGFIAGLQSVIPEAQVVQRVDGKGLKDEAVKVSTNALTAHKDVNIIFGINDDSALGGLQAFRALALDESNLLAVGFGCEGNACKSALLAGGPYKVSAAMFPEFQGRLLIDAAIMAYNGVKLPWKLVAPSLPMTAELLPQYYTQQGDAWVPNFDAMAKLGVQPIESKP